MTDYILGTATSAAAANITQIQQQASLPQTPVFNQNTSGTRMLMFAFDGTWNSKDDPTFGNPGNVAHIYDAAKAGLIANNSGDAFYYKGAGTGGPLNRVIDGATGMSVPATVAKAYNDLIEYANQNPTVAITVGTTGFSRGAASARAFMNAVWEQGIPDTSSQVSLGFDPTTNIERFGYTRYLVEPQKADLGIAILYDSVATGIARQPDLMRIPPAARLKVFQLVAEDERRSEFASDSVVDPNNPNDSRITQWVVAGAHSDVGGTYAANGIGLKTLDIGYSLLKNSGVPMADLAASLQYSGQALLVHDSFKGMHGPDAGPQTGGYVVESRLQNARTYTNLPTISSRDVQVFNDGSKVETITYADGTKQVLDRDGKWQVVRDTVTTRNSDGSVFQVSVTTLTSAGTTTRVTDGQNNLIQTVNRQTFDDGSAIEVVTKPNGVIVTRSFDTQDESASTITDTPDGTGGIIRTIATTTVNGEPFQITQRASAASLANGEQPGDYTTTAVKINGAAAVNNNLIAASIDDQFPSAKDIILNRGTGEFTHIVAAGDPTSPDGVSASLATVTGRVDWWNDPTIGALASDTVSLISALRSGKPLPIATAGLNFASHHLADPAVADIAAALSAVGSLKGLVDALEKGDLGRILIDGGGVARSAITIYSNSLQQEMITRFGSVFRAGELGANGNTAAADLYNSGQAADALLQTVGYAIAVLNIFNSVINGDVKGAVIGAVALYFGPVYGAILTAIDYLYGSFFPNEHQFEANGRYVGGANGEITVQVDNVNGGAYIAFVDRMNLFLDQTRKQAIEIGKLNGQPMGVIAERLPTIEFKQDVMFLRFNDPLSGQSFVRTFDMKGKYLALGYVENVLNADQTSIQTSPWGDNPDNHYANRSADPADITPGNQIATAKIFFDNIARQYSDAVTLSGAIAPLWEVETINLQRHSGYRYAGQTTEAIAYQSGTSYNKYQDFNLYYGAPGDARPGNHTPFGTSLDANSQQTATVIALDLNGDGVITITKKATGNGVLFDVDNDGFAEETDWIGPRDGILVLDRTSSGEPADGQINRGVDLFNYTWVDGARRQLSVLNEIDEDGNGLSGGNLNAQDPVFSHLKVWLDINGEGVAQEEKTLLTIESVATYEGMTRARDRFDIQFGLQNVIAANDGAWEVAA